jgi:Gas vesicle synthesis protein GvpL/GvpF
VPRNRSVTDDLGRWVAERAPAVLAQAEAEAVAVLRDALVTAATVRSKQAETVAHAATARSSEKGDLLWAYCVVRASDDVPSDLIGIESATVERQVSAGLAALVSRVPRAQFGAEPLQRHLNEIAWLERVARAHEGVLDRVLGSVTIVPLRMCTLYENSDSVLRMLERERRPLLEALEMLDGRHEWGVKVLVAPEQLMQAAWTRNTQVLEEELDVSGEGGAYMARRRVERQVRELADALATEIAGQVHACLQDWAIDAVRRPPQNRELSGHEGQMLLNAAYLIEAERIDELRQLIAELESRHRKLGARIELTGPWPPYNFVPGGEPASLA